MFLSVMAVQSTFVERRDSPRIRPVLRLASNFETQYRRWVPGATPQIFVVWGGVRSAPGTRTGVSVITRPAAGNHCGELNRG